MGVHLYFSNYPYQPLCRDLVGERQTMLKTTLDYPVPNQV